MSTDHAPIAHFGRSDSHSDQESDTFEHAKVADTPEHIESDYTDTDRREVLGLEWLEERIRSADSIEASRSQEDSGKRQSLSEKAIEEWSFILQDHLSFGNNKLRKDVAIFNTGTASACMHADTEQCQVPHTVCYAHQAEMRFPGALDRRRRQEYLWNCLDVDTFARAFVRILERKTNPVTALRINEAGDLRLQGEVVRLEHIARRLSSVDVEVYLYTASSHLDFTGCEYLTVNASNDEVVGADRRFIATDDPDSIDGIRCPHDIDSDIKCGTCRACIGKRAGNVHTVIH